MAKKASKASRAVAGQKTIKRGRQPTESPVDSQGRPTAAEEIDQMIEALGDWRGKTLARIRKLIKQADPEVVEEIKWRKPSNAMAGVPVWSHSGIICTGEPYKDKLKLTFANGVALEDPGGLFNASLGGNARRAIDIREGEVPDDRAFKALIRAAVTLNTR